MNLDCPLLIRTPADLIAIVPYLLGFHPADSIVVIGTKGGRITFGARHDLPPPGGLDAIGISQVVAGQSVDAAVLIGYGPAGLVTAPALRLEHELLLAGVPVREVLRVTGGRWWSYSRADDSPLAEGTPCSPADGLIAAEATYRGQVALPDRRALVAQVAAVTGTERAALTEATARARGRLTTLVAEDERAARAGRWLRRAGREAVREAETRARAGRALSRDDLAWLTVLLTVTDVADYAIDRTSDQPWRIRLWTEVLRAAEPDLVPTPACLLGLAAWRDGQGALARVAVDRALQADPTHELAGTLDRLLASGIGPDAVEWPAFTAKPSTWPPDPGGPPPEEFAVAGFLSADVLAADLLPPVAATGSAEAPAVPSEPAAGWIDPPGPGVDWGGSAVGWTRTAAAAEVVSAGWTGSAATASAEIVSGPGAIAEPVGGAVPQALLNRAARRAAAKRPAHDRQVRARTRGRARYRV